MTARTPEQDEARLPAESEPADSRQIRRRLTFGVAGDLADLPATLSPWQRAYEAWRSADLRWRHGAPPRERANPAPADHPRPRNTARATPDPAPSPDRPAKQRRKKPRATKTPTNTTPSAPPAANTTPVAGAPAPGNSSSTKPTPAKDAATKPPTAKPAPAETAAAGPSAAKSARVESSTAKPSAGARGRGRSSTAKPAPVEDTAAKPSGAAPAQVEPTRRPKVGGVEVVTGVGGTPVAGAALKAAAPERDSGEKGGQNRRLQAGIAGAAVLVLVAVGVVFALGGEEAEKPRVAGAVAADRLFAADPAAKTDGLVQDLAAVVSDGTATVATGTEGTGAEGAERTAFLVSAAGKGWRTARVRADDGAEPPLGDRPRLLAAGAGTWVALGAAADGAVVVWTSGDGGTWTRRPAPAFGKTDKVNALARTGQGFVAVGATGDGAVVWSSADGRVWQRVSGLRAPGVTGFDRVAASGGVLVAHGTSARKVTKRKGKRKVTRTVRGDGFWRSADGGRTWSAVIVPQQRGSFGATKGLAVGPGGFATVREGHRTTGRKKHRKTTRFGVLFTSADGLAWRAAGTFGGADYLSVERFGGAAAGLAVLVRGAKGRSVLLGDGRTWRPAGVGSLDGVEVSGLTVAGGAVTLAGHRDGDAFLSGVDLKGVPGAVHAERTVRSVAAGQGRAVAVGSTNGGAAVWTAAGGRAWTRAGFPASGGWLSDVVYGVQGWLAVGRTSGASPGPLALASQDGTAWRRAPFPGGPAPVAVAAGPAGYVAVGTGAAWRSSDLKGWRRADVEGAPADVAATAKGYVAVGGRDKAPAVWTSPDGVKWSPVKLPAGLAEGPLSEVAARGDVLVAVGAGAAPLVSADGGATWAPRPLAGAASLTAVAATPRGFAVAAATGARDAAVWASGDGAAWRRVPVSGLDGPGDQRLTAMTALGGEVLAVGTSADHRGESALLWRAAAP
ncbi:hypothetical protein [Actinomadura fibrosa]|uniref:Exo-alpha-sialidase n=1 Tax=Actinomadura fibrosa TaxID=111802 RepID=A0ABW2XA24_9ACTN|nr:hypothetical protein [Actinomadura fibrosa]